MEIPDELKSMYDALRWVHKEWTDEQCLAEARRKVDLENRIQAVLAEDDMTYMRNDALAALKLIDSPEHFSGKHNFATADDERLDYSDVYMGYVIPVGGETNSDDPRFQGDNAIRDVLSRYSGLGAFLYAGIESGQTDDTIRQYVETWKYCGGNVKPPVGHTKHEEAQRTIYRIIGECEEYLNDEYCRLEEELSGESDE